MTSALLVIDFQRGLIDDEPRPGDVERTTENINALMENARRGGVPVVLIQHEDNRGLVRDSSPWELAKELQAGAGDFRVGKRTPDSFLGTELESLLTSLGVKHVVVCGYASEFCVDTTVRRAAALGYPVTIAADAHTTHDKPHAKAAQIREHHNATLSDIGSFGPKIRAIPVALIDFNALA
ncbi:isochorismatase [Pandoraea pneumonica]|uniref:Isochorismatase n=1 Tax=Pandoraea pneumonica TaxID=2508299 RepID=A0A5E4YM53_9BURK|nr:cysteine hydrolase family protein [Pandoraea pneumonica]VVE49622.1 isochorismatase [Pandoraea pneumonica]